MTFERVIQGKDITIYCDHKLYNFSKEFIKYYKKDIIRIKKELGLTINIEAIFALFSDTKPFEPLPYKETNPSFAGFFTDTGVAAFIKQNGKYSNDDLYKRLMHEIIHYLYQNFIYGKRKKRITWVDEGLACFLSNQYYNLDNHDKYQNFIRKNLLNNINLNNLNHEDQSFGNQNGYNLSYIAIRYLYENNTHEEFLNIIKNKKRLKKIGNTILSNIKKKN